MCFPNIGTRRVRVAKKAGASPVSRGCRPRLLGNIHDVSAHSLQVFTNQDQAYINLAVTGRSH
jgi:hypothetical protein